MTVSEPDYKRLEPTIDLELGSWADVVVWAILPWQSVMIESTTSQTYLPKYERLGDV